MKLFISIFIKFFFLFTPFFLLSTFLSMTRDASLAARRKIALKVAVAVAIICAILFLIGNQIFYLFGITINSFRVGTGVLLFLSAVTLVRGAERVGGGDIHGDISVVPLAIPITVGPATTGALLVLGGELDRLWDKIIGMAALFAAIVCIGAMLYLSSAIERIFGRLGLEILSKITGLVLAALAAQMIMQGINDFFA